MRYTSENMKGDSLKRWTVCLLKNHVPVSALGGVQHGWDHMEYPQLQALCNSKGPLLIKIEEMQHANPCSRDHAELVSFTSELLWVALSPLMQCLTIHGCFWTSLRGIRFSGSRTSN